MFNHYNQNKIKPQKYLYKYKNQTNDQRGSISVMSAVLLIPLLSFMALAIDVGYLYVVRNELQNAADAAALAGASYLYPMVVTNGVTTPNFSVAATKAGNAISLNKAANSLLIATGGSQITTGYWNIHGKTNGAYSGVHPTMDTAVANLVNDWPAIQVTINKENGNSNGPVNTFFAKVFNINTVNEYATAVAVVPKTGPGCVKGLFPVAIPQCMYNSFWDTVKDQPKIINPSPSTTPYDFIIGSSYHYTGCSDTSVVGQWTSLGIDSNNVPTIRDLIDIASGKGTPSNNLYCITGTNVTGSINSVWIEPGTKTTLYTSVDDCSSNGDGSCAYIIVPVVCTNSPECNDVEAKVQAPIMGFACLHIVSADKQDKTITAQMVAPGTTGSSKCKLPINNGGPEYGIYQPPRLVNYSGNTY